MTTIKMSAAAAVSVKETFKQKMLRYKWFIIPAIGGPVVVGLLLWRHFA